MRHPATPRSRLFAPIAAIALVIGTLGGVAANTVAPSPAHADPAPSGGLFQAATGRILDTRNGTGGYSSPLSTAFHAVSVDGVAGLPSSGISAVQVNFLVIAPTHDGGIHADADGVATPNTTVTYVDYTATTHGQIYSNSAIIPVGSDGKIQVEPTSSADLVVDIQGYYTSGSTAAGGYVPVDAAVVAYTADGTGGIGTSEVPTGGVITFQVGGVASVPATASAVVLGVQEISPSANPGALIAYPEGAAQPQGGMQWAANHSGSWTTTVALPSSGKVNIKVTSGGSVDVKAEVEGYFASTSGSAAAGAFTPSVSRVYDSRTHTSLGAGQTTTVQLAGVGGLPNSGAGMSAVAMDITVLPGSANGHLQASADDVTPIDSTMYFSSSYDAVSSFAIVTIGADGGVSIQNSSANTIDFVLDVEGWYSGQLRASNGSPTNSSTGVSSQPTLAATAVDSSGVSSLGYQYFVSRTSNFSTGLIWSSDTGQGASVNVPADAQLLPSTQYFWRVQVTDPGSQGAGEAVVDTVASSFTTFANHAPASPSSGATSPWKAEPDPSNPDVAGAMATSYSPTFSAMSTDFEGSDLNYTFEVHTSQSSSPSSLIEACTTPSATSSGSKSTCGVGTPLVDGMYWLRSKANDGILDSPWSSWAQLPVSGIVTAQILFDTVFSSPDPDAALAALDPASHQLLVDNGLIASGDSLATDPSDADTAQWTDITPSSDSALTYAPDFVAPTSDSGSASYITSVKSSVPTLIDADASVGSLTSQQIANPSLAEAAAAKSNRAAIVAQAWTSSRTSAQTDAWESTISTELNNSATVGYSSDSYAVDHWDGVSVSSDGLSATATVEGHDSYSLNDGSTLTEDPAQDQISLSRTAVGSSWSLDSLKQAVTDQTQGSSIRKPSNPISTVPAGDLFNRNAAVKYADKYTCNGYDQGECRNTFYTFLATKEDCTDFVSQSLTAAGFQPDVPLISVPHDPHGWYYANEPFYSESFITVKDFKQYMDNNKGYVSMKEIPRSDWDKAKTNAKPGDIYAYNLFGGGIDHLALAVGNGTLPTYHSAREQDTEEWFPGTNWKNNYGSLIDQHTTDRLHAPWNWAYLLDKKKKDTKAIAKMHIYVLHYNF